MIDEGWIGGRQARRGGERGASLVEFAILAPLLIVLLLGIVEFGWGIAQQLDLRHKAREALRVAVVDGTVAEIRNRVCSDDIVDNAAIIRIQNLASGTDPGDTAGVVVEADLIEITGFFDWAWPSATIESEVYGRVEQPTTNWAPGAVTTCP